MVTFQCISRSVSICRESLIASLTQDSAALAAQVTLKLILCQLSTKSFGLSGWLHMPHFSGYNCHFISEDCHLQLLLLSQVAILTQEKTALAAALDNSNLQTAALQEMVIPYNCYNLSS